MLSFDLLAIFTLKWKWLMDLSVGSHLGIEKTTDKIEVHFIGQPFKVI